jgi:uncharacterized membrane protein
MDWLSLALISLVIGVAVSLFDKYTLGKASAAAYLFLIGVVNALTIFFVPLGYAQMPTAAQWTEGILLGVLFAVIIYMTFRAFQQEEISRLLPLGILSTILISVGSAVFFDERLTTNQYWAFALFIVGAFFLTTRIVYKVELLDDISNFRIQKISRQTQRMAQDAFLHPYDTSRKFFWTMYDVFDKQWDSPVIDYLKYKRKLKLIRGLWWYLGAVALTIPYTLLAKQHNEALGLAAGFMTIRVGLFVGSFLLVIPFWHEVVYFAKHRLFFVAGAKEVVSIASGFIWWAAATTGPLSIVLSLGSLQSALVFVAGSVLAYFGIIRESLKRRDVMQKSIGVLFATIATILLFL